MTDFGLDEDDLRQICDALGKYPEIEKTILYGSRAKGNFKPHSDIDLALTGKLDNKLTLNVHSELEELPLPYKFDVLHYDTLTHENLKDHIDRVGKVIYEKEAS